MKKLFSIFGFIGFAAVFAVAQPKASFNATPPNGCAPATIQFNNQSTGSSLTYFWDLGNGNTSTVKNPQAIYYNPGLYTIKLIVKDGSGKKDSLVKTKYVEVFKNPVADFTATTFKGCSPFDPQLIDKSTRGSGMITQWTWDYNDGAVLGKQNPSHAYVTDGVYDISLVIKDANGCESKALQKQIITVYKSPVAAFVADNVSACQAPFKVNFTSKSTPTSKSDTYSWDFGDGSTSGKIHPSKTYNNLGDYTVKLTLKSPNGCENTAQINNYIRVTKIKPAFTASVNQACINSVIEFTNNSSPKGLSFLCNWNFGDSTTGKGAKIKHSYSKPGTYTIKLTVSLSDGTCSETLDFPNSISIYPKPQARFFVTDTILCYPGLKDTLVDKSIGNNSRFWHLNDSLISTNAWVSRRISRKGYHKVSLVVGNGYCYDTLTKPKAILVDTTKPSFTLSAHYGCKPLKIHFTETTSTGPQVVSVFWDLGDGNFQYQNDFDYVYDKPGRYIIKLKITNEWGCSFTARDTIYVGEKPDLELPAKIDSICNYDLLSINNVKNKNSSVITSWKWMLDTAVISKYKDLNYKVKEKDGTHTLKLIAESFGCYDTVTLDGGLKILPPYLYYSIDYDKCKGYPYRFINRSQGADIIRWYFSDSTFIENRDTVFVNGPSDKWPVKIWGRNNRYGCEGAYKDYLQPVVRSAGFEIAGNYCAPANLTMLNQSINYNTYKWDWGDGKLWKNNNGYIPKQYANAGTYKIKLYAIADNGCKDSIIKQIKITGPKATSEIKQLTSCPPIELNLINHSNIDGLKSKYWQISGLPSIAISNDTMPFTLTKPGPLPGGKYVISLVLEDNDGCIGKISDTVTIKTNPFGLKVNSIATCKFPIYTFEPRSLNNDSSIFRQAMFWNTGDGGNYSGPIITHQFPEAGKYTVSLKIMNSDGCITQEDTVILNENKVLNADFVADKIDADCPPLKVDFKSKSISTFGKISKYYWDFGDGSTSELENPSHVYIVAGKFTVKLKIYNDFNCSDEIIFKDLILINGPEGKYSFDKKSGCTPLQVKFTATTFNTYSLEWDMGDGQIIKDSMQTGYTYDRVGDYIPMLVLSDSFGCKYTLTPIDTIKVFPAPIAKFKYSTPCIRQEIAFQNLSNPVKDTLKQSFWDFGDGTTSTEYNPTHIFNKKGSFKVKLTVWNAGGCAGFTEQTIKVKDINAAFTTGKPFYCNGEVPSLIDQSTSDTNIISTRWFLNGTFISANKKPTLPPLSSGLHKIMLAVADRSGCLDTIVLDKGIIIGDTTTPVAPFIYRVSVNDDYALDFDFSANRNYDFSKYSIYQKQTDNTFKKVKEITDINDTSVIINGVNTLKTVYCFKVTTRNLCAYESDLLNTPEHCSIEAKATGEIRKISVKWNPYRGWPVKQYDIYRELVGNKGNYQYLASVDGSTTSYIDTVIYCKTDHFYRIKAYELGGYQTYSWSDTTAARPSTDHAVPPNETIRATVDFDKEITIEWTGSGNPRIPIDTYVIERADDGIHYKWYQNFKPNEFSFTDKKVKVDNQSYFYRTYAIDTCGQKSKVLNFAKTILLKADTTPQERPYVHWSTYQGWNEGVNEYEVQLKKPDGTFVTIGHTKSTDTMLVDEVTDLNGHPWYCYRVIGYKNLASGQKQVISISNEDCAPVRSRIFAANAFTINGDNLNETFDIKGLYIKEYNIKVFNRWGEKIFESNDMNVDWDGYYKGELAQMDAYIWIIKAIGVDNVNWPMNGTVTIIR